MRDFYFLMTFLMSVFFILYILLLCLVGGRASSQVFPGSQRADCSSGVPGRFWDVRLHSLQQTGKSGSFYSARRSWLVCGVEVFWALAAHLSVSNCEFFHIFSERVMPYFAQEPLSYLTLPTIKNAYKSFSIKINFRPDNVDGEEAQWIIMSLLVESRSCCVYNICLIFSCLISLRLLSLSLPPPPPSHTLAVGRSHIVRWWVSELENHRNSSVTLAVVTPSDFRILHPAQSCERDGAWPFFSDRLFFIMITNALLGNHHHNKSPDINLFYIPMPFINELLYCWYFFMAVSLCRKSHSSKNNYYFKYLNVLLSVYSNYIKKIFILPSF